MGVCVCVCVYVCVWGGGGGGVQLRCLIYTCGVMIFIPCGRVCDT